jgi:hypothetical protein
VRERVENHCRKFLLGDNFAEEFLVRESVKVFGSLLKIKGIKNYFWDNLLKTFLVTERVGSVWECDFNKCNFKNCVFKNCVFEIVTF